MLRETLAPAPEKNIPELDAAYMRLSPALEVILRLRPAGLSELDLIRELQKAHWNLLGEVDFTSPQQLFPVHFLLFHSLYRLRNNLILQQESLHISALQIRISRQTSTGGDQIDHPDPLAGFYLDSANFHLPGETITRMLEDFWRGISTPPQRPDIHQALSLLEFEQTPENFQLVKLRYRKLAMQHHPDRGGDTGRLQALNAALDTLRRHYNLSR